MNLVPVVPLPQMVPVQQEEQVGVQELVLRERQIPWAHTVYNILLRAHGYLDTSKMGSGKTFVTLWLALQFGFRLLIVGLPTLEEMWRSAAARCGVEVIDFISYQSLRSMKGHQPKHGYLHREDSNVGGKNYVSFQPTQGYLDLVSQGILLVCDEIDKIKNKTAQNKALCAMTSPIVTEGGVSRFAFLSGIPFDKESHAVQLLRAMGYIRSERLYSYNRYTGVNLDGIQELVMACHQLDPDTTGRILAELPPTERENLKTLIYTLYSEVVLANVGGSMPPPDLDVLFDAKNGFYRIHPQRLADLRRGVLALMLALKVDVDHIEPTAIVLDNMGEITTALMTIERAKADDMGRVAAQILRETTTAKVIISLNYKENIRSLAAVLEALGYRTLILSGDVPVKRRHFIIQSFNNDLTQRVLLMTTAVGGHGINLHDTVGNAPRYLLISPSYTLLNIAQATYRIYRDGSTSDAVIRMFYGQGPGAQELNIIDAIARKTATAKGTVVGPAKNNLLLPGDYEAEYE